MSRLHMGLLIVVAALLVSAGCSGKTPLYPVTGKVVSKSSKKPATGAMVFFDPIPTDPKRTARAMGTVDEEGTYWITSHTAKDGLPAGDYVITLIWPPPQKSLLD